MKNNNLVPTTITDKNGKITTVHKKQQKTSVATHMPSPSLPVKRSTSEVRLAVTKRIKELYELHHDSGSDHESFIASEVSKYSENTLHNVDLALREDNDLSRSVAQHIVYAGGATSVNETIYYYFKTESDDYWSTEAELRALRYYSAVSMHSDLTVVDESTQKSCLALMKFARLIDTLPSLPSPFLDYIPDSEMDSMVINNDSLATLIANRPDDVERIAEIVLRLGTSNAAAINGLLDGALPTLAEGHL